MQLLPIILFILIFGGFIWLLLSRYAKHIQFPLVLPQTGFSVPVINAYIGSVWFNIHNGLYPSLKFFDDDFEYVVLLKKTINYAAILEVGARTGFWVGGPTLVLKFNNGSWNFCANMNKGNLVQVLKFLQGKNIKINQEALDLIAN